MHVWHELSGVRTHHWLLLWVRTRPTAGDIAVFLPLTQADIDRKAAGGADVSQMEPDGTAWSSHAIQNCPSNNTTPELADLTSRFAQFLGLLCFPGLSQDGIRRPYQ